MSDEKTLAYTDAAIYGIRDLNDNAVYPVVQTFTIGRSQDCDFTLHSGHSSRHHATLSARGFALKIEDENSQNGTYVNQERIQSSPLQAGDIIQIDQASFEVVLLEQPPTEVSAETTSDFHSLPTEEIHEPVAPPPQPQQEQPAGKSTIVSRKPLPNAQPKASIEVPQREIAVPETEETPLTTTTQEPADTSSLFDGTSNSPAQEMTDSSTVEPKTQSDSAEKWKQEREAALNKLNQQANNNTEPQQESISQINPQQWEQQSVTDNGTVVINDLDKIRPDVVAQPQQKCFLYGYEGKVAKEKIILSKNHLTLGSANADIVINDGAISGTHAEVKKVNDQWHISDCGSTNGTFVNGKKVGSEDIAINTGDLIKLGTTALILNQKQPGYNATNKASPFSKPAIAASLLALIIVAVSVFLFIPSEPPLASTWKAQAANTPSFNDDSFLRLSRSDTNYFLSSLHNTYRIDFATGNISALDNNIANGICAIGLVDGVVTVVSLDGGLYQAGKKAKAIDRNMSNGPCVISAIHEDGSQLISSSNYVSIYKPTASENLPEPVNMEAPIIAAYPLKSKETFLTITASGVIKKISIGNAETIIALSSSTTSIKSLDEEGYVYFNDQGELGLIDQQGELIWSKSIQADIKSAQLISDNTEISILSSNSLLHFSLKDGSEAKAGDNLNSTVIAVTDSPDNNVYALTQQNTLLTIHNGIFTTSDTIEGLNITNQVTLIALDRGFLVQQGKLFTSITPQ